MPSSNLALATSIVEMANVIRPRTVLDVGPGYGKYGLLTREYVRSVERIDAMEAESRYVDSFPWNRALYNYLYVLDATTAPATAFEGYDLVLMLDVIEHMEREDGFRVLDECPHHVIIATPVDFFQNPEHELFPSEKHRSVWTVEDFADLDRPIVVNEYAKTVGGVLVALGPKGGR